jgi:hypothetical protein
MGSLLSFLGGSAFRMIWGEISSFVTKRQDHKFEIERMKLQGSLEAELHARNLEAQRLQVELGHKTIAIPADADVSRSEADAFRIAMEQMQKPTGIDWVDAWNGIIRPAFATAALALWLWYEFSHMALNGWVITAFSMDLIAVVAGFYFADRSLRKRGK